MRKEIKAIAASSAFGLLSGAAFADGTSTTVDTSAVQTLLTGLNTNLGSWVTSALPVLGTIAGSFLLFWLGKVVFRVVKGWANKAG